MRTTWNWIRKFGPGYCDLPTMVENVSFFLRILTVNIDTRNKRRIPFIFYITTITVIGIYFYVYLFSMAWFVFWRCPQTGDLVAAMVVLSLGVCSEISTMKIFNMLAYSNKIRKLVEGYLACDSLVVPGTRFSKNLMRVLRNAKIRAIIYWLIIIFNGVTYIAIQIFKPGRSYMDDMFVIYGLEPSNETPNYQISLIFTCASVSFVCYAAANVTAFIIIITGYTEAQMVALSEELIHIWDDALEQRHNNTIEIKIEALCGIFKGTSLLDDNSRCEVNAFVKRRLREIIKNHSRNVDLLREVENSFRVAFAIGFVFLIVGLIAELLGGLENTYMQIPFTFIQVSMDCWTGQRVIDASVIFERAVYDCKWENFDSSNMKIVLLVLRNSQKTMTLSAGGMTMLSFSYLMSIIRSVYSTYTTLRSMIN